jgi:phosphatidylglycerophosphate synthase
MSDGSLDAWSRLHAWVMLGSFGVSVAAGRPWIVAIAALGTFLLLLVPERRNLLPSSSGAANLVTLFRWFLVLGLGFWPEAPPDLGRAATLLGLLALDGVDGWLARRYGSSTAFGARFDMETDALAVLLAALAIAPSPGFSAWIWVPGLLRYVYVLLLHLIPPAAPEPPPTLLGRLSFSALMLGLILASGFESAITRALLAAGATVVTLSFGRSFYWLYFKRAPR